MQKIKIGNQEYKIPNHWNELAMDSLIFLSSQTQKGVTVDELKVKMVLHLLNAYIFENGKRAETELYRVHIGKEIHFLDVEDFMKLKECANFLFEVRKVKVKDEEKEISALSSQLYKCPFKKFPCGCAAELHNPGDTALSDITFGEMNYIQTINAAMQVDFWDNLDKMIGILFRNRNKPFNPQKIFDYATDVSKASRNLKMIAYWHYVGSMNRLEKKFPTVFQRTGEAYKAGGVFNQQMELVIELANDDITKVEDVNNTLYYTVLFRLEKTNKEAEESKKAAEKIKKSKK